MKKTIIVELLCLMFLFSNSVVAGDWCSQWPYNWVDAHCEPGCSYSASLTKIEYPDTVSPNELFTVKPYIKIDPSGSYEFADCAACMAASVTHHNSAAAGTVLGNVPVMKTYNSAATSTISPMSIAVQAPSYETTLAYTVTWTTEGCTGNVLDDGGQFIYIDVIGGGGGDPDDPDPEVDPDPDCKCDEDDFSVMEVDAEVCSTHSKTLVVGEKICVDVRLKYNGNCAECEVDEVKLSDVAFDWDWDDYEDATDFDVGPGDKKWVGDPFDGTPEETGSVKMNVKIAFEDDGYSTGPHFYLNIVDGSCLSLSCSNGSLYCVQSNGNFGELSQNCESGSSTSYGSPQCKDGHVKKLKTVTTKGCQNGACYTTPSTSWVLVENCGNYGCSNGICDTPDPCATKKCYNNDLYCYDSNGNKGNKSKECGNNSTSYGSTFCSGNKVYKKKYTYSKGCSGGACYENTSSTNEYQTICKTGGKIETSPLYCDGDEFVMQDTQVWDYDGCVSGSCKKTLQNEFSQMQGQCLGSEVCEDAECICPVDCPSKFPLFSCEGSNSTTCIPEDEGDCYSKLTIPCGFLGCNPFNGQCVLPPDCEDECEMGTKGCESTVFGASSWMCQYNPQTECYEKLKTKCSENQKCSAGQCVKNCGQQCNPLVPYSCENNYQINCIWDGDCYVEVPQSCAFGCNILLGTCNNQPQCVSTCEPDTDGCVDGDTKWICSEVSEDCFKKVNFNCGQDEVCDNGLCKPDCISDCFPIPMSYCIDEDTQGICLFDKGCYKEQEIPCDFGCLDLLGQCSAVPPYESNCEENDKGCDNGQVWSCEEVSAGCFQKEYSDCNDGYICQNGVCKKGCDDECVPWPMVKCDGNDLVVCIQEGLCTKEYKESCALGCNPLLNKCIECDNECESNDHQCKDDNTLLTCVNDGPCLKWSETSCQEGTYCKSGACVPLEDCAATKCLWGDVWCFNELYQTTMKLQECGDVSFEFGSHYCDGNAIMKEMVVKTPFCALGMCGETEEAFPEVVDTCEDNEFCIEDQCVPLDIPCMIKNVWFATSNATDGDAVLVFVETSGTCANKTVNFTLRRQELGGDMDMTWIVDAPAPLTLLSAGTSTTFWTATFTYFEDKLDMLVGKVWTEAYYPSYILTAHLDGQSKDSQNSIKVEPEEIYIGEVDDLLEAYPVIHDAPCNPFPGDEESALNHNCLDLLIEANQIAEADFHHKVDTFAKAAGEVVFWAWVGSCAGCVGLGAAAFFTEGAACMVPAFFPALAASCGFCGGEATVMTEGILGLLAEWRIARLYSMISKIEAAENVVMVSHIIDDIQGSGALVHVVDTLEQEFVFMLTNNKVFPLWANRVNFGPKALFAYAEGWNIAKHSAKYGGYIANLKKLGPKSIYWLDKLESEAQFLSIGDVYIEKFGKVWGMPILKPIEKFESESVWGMAVLTEELFSKMISTTKMELKIALSKALPGLPNSYDVVARSIYLHELSHHAVVSSILHHVSEMSFVQWGNVEHVFHELFADLLQLRNQNGEVRAAYAQVTEHKINKYLAHYTDDDIINQLTQYQGQTPAATYMVRNNVFRQYMLSEEIGHAEGMQRLGKILYDYDAGADDAIMEINEAFDVLDAATKTKSLAPLMKDKYADVVIEYKLDKVPTGNFVSTEECGASPFIEDTILGYANGQDHEIPEIEDASFDLPHFVPEEDVISEDTLEVADVTEEEITTDVIVEDTVQDDYPFDLTIVSLSENDIEIHIMGYGKMLTEESISVPTFLTNDGKERLFELQKFKSSEAHTSYRFVFSGGCAFFEEPTPTTVTFDFDGYSFEEAVEVEYSLCMVGEAPSGCNSSPTKGAHPLGLILLFALLISSAICLRYCRR